jgi:hypothetical protein
MSRIARVAALALTLLACHHDPPEAPAAAATPSASDGAPSFVEADFAQLYPLFLAHKAPEGPKAALWVEHYYRRWVRWAGRVRSFTPNGVTLRELYTTSTFDVSLWINNAERDAVRARYHVGDVIEYVGRLDSYDDIWRTLYLVNGSVLGPGADIHDAGF